MASSFYWKLRALIKKNLILMKRNILFSIFEIFFPVFIFFILVLLRKALKIHYSTFEEKEGDTLNYTNTYFISSITNITDKHEIKPKKATWLNFPLVHPFYICSKYNLQKQSRPIIASIGIPQEIKDQMIKDSEYSQELIDLDFKLSNNSFKEFSSIEEMENHIKSKEYLSDPNNLICFGLRFSYDDITKKYDYSLHFFDYEKKGKEGIQDIPTDMYGMFLKFQTGPDLDDYIKYKNGAYSYMMKIVNQYILRKETGDKEAQLNFGTIPMKYIDYRFDTYLDFEHVIIIVIHIAYMIPLTLYVYRIVGEKESRIKEGMKIMGLKEREYFLSYFLQYLVINIIISFFNSLLLKLVLIHIPLYILYFIVFLFSLDIFALIYFFQSFVDKTRTAIIITLFFYLLMYCTFLVCLLDKTSIIFKTILSLIPSVSFSLGIIVLNRYEAHFKNFKSQDFSMQYFNYSIEIQYIMFIIDFFLYLFLGYYLHNVLPHEFGIRKPWYFLCSSKYWKKSKRRKRKFSIKKNINKIELTNVGDNNSVSLIDNKNNNNLPTINDNDDNDEYEYEDDFYNETFIKNDVIEIKNIVKIYEDGKKALDGVNLNLYKDEIFALLGHNGAGKTTLISILTGIYEATKGEVLYDGINVLDGNNMDLFREKIGICPQYDTLFDNLTVKEHLEMFSIFKGVKSDKLDLEVNKILHDFQFENCEDVTAKNLSLGQRRKLSIAIALCGGSEIIFLDEPSSGIDITSRRNLWDILKHLSKGKIIIFTTHYMEEASILGKRIGIISLGHMKCIGSPLFLIEKYGKFMNLNVSKEEDADNKKIVDFISSIAENVEYEILSEEIMFRIPVKDDENKLKKLDISNFFKILDQNINDLKIKSYSVSMPTLEDVFLNLASSDNNNTITKNNENLIESENDKIIFDPFLKEKYSKSSKFWNDFYINMKRRFLIMKRDRKGFILEVIGPILLVLAGLILSTIEMTSKSYPIVVDLDITGKQKIIFSSFLYYNNLSSYYINDSNLVTSEGIEHFGDSYEHYEKTNAVIDFVDKVFELSKHTEDSKLKEIDMTEEDYVGYYSSLLMLEERNHKYEYIMVLNARVKHCIPIYTHFLSKAIIEKAINHERKIDIKFTHYPLPLTYDIKDERLVGNKYAVVFFLSAALAIMPANYIYLLVTERVNNSKHLMRISGLNIASYWIVNYLFEIVKYYITAGICFLLLYAFNFYKDYFYIFYITLGPGLISLTYIMSCFLDESSAQNIVIIINFIIGNVGAIIVIVLRTSESVKNIGKLLEYILSIIPSFCFDFSLNLLLNTIGVYFIDYPDEWLSFGPNVIIEKFNLLLSMILFSSIECVLYTVILIIVESRSYHFKKPTNYKLLSDIKDTGVIDEIKNCNINNEIKNNNDKNYILRINNLKKIFKDMFCCNCKSKNNDIIAIKNLNFGIKKGECFGILGLNGAGKTTTFKCITQELSQDNGCIFINGENIAGNFEKLNEIIGYCPQFGAIFENLTVYENLEYYARIKGIKIDKIDLLVNAMIKEMSLEEFKNKEARKLSGGNKRKLSVAISMIGNPPILLLDEPSFGIDPEARRFMWSIIHKMTTKGEKSSTIISTHSMDEAETLCKRIGIMVNGEFVCIGRINDIKEKYGYGYEINIRIKPIEDNLKEEILKKHNLNNTFLVTQREIEAVLNNMGKKYYLEELKDGRLGERIKKEMYLKGSVNIGVLINWIFMVENAFKFIQKGKDYFEEIILVEHFENSFLFKLKRGKDTKSIGFFFGLYEENKEECHVSEYSIQLTSLEQIFNKFTIDQNKIIDMNEENSTLEENKNIIIDDILLNNLFN